MFLKKWPPVAILDVHFRSIPQFLFCEFFTKWLPAAILDVRKSLSVAFLAILDQYKTFLFFLFLQNGHHFGCPKFTFDRISGHFRSVRNFFFVDVRNSFWITFLAILDQYRFFYSGHFGCSKITFDLISGHFRSIRNCLRPFQFESHFWPF